MVRGLEGEKLDGWLEEASTSEAEVVRKYAAGLKKDLSAVRAGLTERLSNRPVEGFVHIVSVAPRMRPGQDLDHVQTATKFALRSVARRHQALSEEIAELDAQLDRLVAEAAPELISLPAIGTDHAATLLLTVGDNPERLGSEASFASLCGVSPVEASSGKVVRHRLNRGGNRDANRCLHLICVVRMRIDERTRRYVARRTAEGKSSREIMRCLKRYIAREVYRVLVPATSPPLIGASTT
jgi:transposase